MTDTEPLTPRDVGIPARAVGMTIPEFLATDPHIDEFWTPLIVLDDTAMRHNVDTMATWCRERGLDLMPHGKTTMSPPLWQRQLDAGAIGITLATMGQIRTAHSLGFRSLMLANSATDERTLRWLARELHDPELRFVSWVDDVRTVEIMSRALTDAAAPRPVDVLVELGAPGGRTGVRTLEGAIEIAEKIAATPALRLAGVAAYEGCLSHERTDEALTVVRDYLRRAVELHERVRHLYGPGEVYITAGGSAYFDVVAEVFGEAGASPDADPHTRFTLRSGAYIVHDDGFYHEISPFDAGRTSADAPQFIPAMHGVARVLSHPEPRLALLDAGKRDFPFDEDLPFPRETAADLGQAWHPLAPDATISAMNDQHSFLRSAAPLPTPVGSVVWMGLSHPCTSFDKWRVLPVVDSWGSGRVIDVVRTYF